MPVCTREKALVCFLYFGVIGDAIEYTTYYILYRVGTILDQFPLPMIHCSNHFYIIPFLIATRSRNLQVPRSCFQFETLVPAQQYYNSVAFAIICAIIHLFLHGNMFHSTLGTTHTHSDIPFYLDFRQCDLDALFTFIHISGIYL